MEEKVFLVVSRIMREKVEMIDRNSSPDNIESWDSARHMDLIMALEEEFDVQFSEEQIIEMMNVGLIIETIRELQP